MTRERGTRATRQMIGTLRLIRYPSKVPVRGANSTPIGSLTADAIRWAAGSSQRRSDWIVDWEQSTLERVPSIPR